MSQENVEMIRQQCAWMAGDPYVLGEMSFIDSDAVYEDALLPDHAGETYHGHDGMRMAWALATEPWDNFKCQLEWARDAGDMVVSGHRVSGRGKGSGIEMEAHYAYVWVFRQNKVVHLTAYLDTAEALDAAGLQE